MKTIVMGFGHSGSRLHVPCLRKAHEQTAQEGLFSRPISVVDPFLSDLVSRESEDLNFSKHLEEADSFHPGETVVHICTPPGTHFEVIEETVRMGYRNFVVEKPLVTKRSDGEKIKQLKREKGLSILVVANWLSSQLTSRIMGEIRKGNLGEPKNLMIEQNKPRFSRSIHNSSHTSAFEVELPHQISLACHIMGVKAEVVDSHCYDMWVGEKCIPQLGGARVTLKHPGGKKSFLKSDLTSMVRKRTIQVEFEKHTLLGFYPSASDDSYAKIVFLDSDGQPFRSELMYDDPLSSCFIDYYRYFTGNFQEKPVSDLDFNLQVMDLLCKAQECYGRIPEASKVSNMLREVVK